MARITSQQDGTKNLTNLLPLKLVLSIMLIFVGIQIGGFPPVGLQLVKHLVSVELGEEVGVGAGVAEVDNGSQPLVSDDSCTSLDNGTLSSIYVEIQEQTTLITMIYHVFSTLPAIFVVLLAGCWIDTPNTSKRTIAIVPSVASALYAACFVVISATNASPWLGLIPASLLGLGGSYLLPFTIVMVYISATTEEDKKTPSILYAIMLYTISSGATSVVVGYLIQDVGFPGTYAILLLLCVFSAAFVTLFLPEIELQGQSADTSSETSQWLRSGLRSMWTNVHSMYADPETGAWRYDLFVILAVNLTYGILSTYFMGLLQLVSLGEPFCWSSILIGYFTAAMLAGVGAGMMITSHILKIWFDDFALAQIGFVSAFVTTLIPAYARTDAGLFLVAVSGAFRCVPSAVLSSKLSKVVDKTRYGTIFGMTGALEYMAILVAPLLFGAVYKCTVEDNPTFVFKLMAGLLVIPSTLILGLQCWESVSKSAKYKKDPKDLLLPDTSSKK